MVRQNERPPVVIPAQAGTSLSFQPQKRERDSSLPWNDGLGKQDYCEQVALSFIPISMIVCVCNAIRECDVRAAARAGASCPTSAYRARGAKPRCGQCFSFAREIIAAERATA
jgi:bacterioferritin-associated ferredoxin